MSPKPSQLSVAALVASVLLHVGLGLWLLRHQDSPARAATQPPLQAQVRWLDAPPPPSPAPAPPSRPAPARAKRTPRPPESAATTPAAPTSSAVTSAPAGDLPVADAPTQAKPSLTPGLGLVFRMAPDGDAEPSHGSTLRNGPDERVDEVAVREYDGERANRAISDDLSRAVAQARGANGMAPPFFHRVQSALSDRSDQVTHGPRTSGENLRDALNVLAPDVSAEAARKVTDSALGRSVSNGVGAVNVDDQRFREAALQQMAWGEAMKERASAARLRTVLELTQDARGTLADVRVVERSGDATFDDSAVHLSRKVLRDLSDADDNGLGSSWWRSRWQFTWEPPRVRVRFMEAWPVSTPMAQ